MLKSAMRGLARSYSLQARVALSLLLAGTAWAECNRTPTDSTFAPDNSAFPNYTVNVRPTSSVDGSSSALVDTKTITITRVVGPGTATEFDANGFLVNWETYFSNGVLSKYAYLWISGVGTVEAGVPKSLGVYLNGQKVAVADEQNAQLLAQDSGGGVCIAIPTQFLKFARRVPGQAPVPGVNVIGFMADTDTQQTLDTSANAVMLGPISFHAMAPIVLVHGWNAGPWIWGPKPAQSSACGVNVHDAGDGGQNLFQSLLDAKAPVDCSFNTNDLQSTITDGATTLMRLFPQILASFGSRHVHLVTHSKGGLFARKFLQLNADQDAVNRIGVVSLTTLDAPHHGSVLSDTVVAYRYDRSVLPVIVSPLYPFLRHTNFRFRNAFGTGNNDMTVSYVQDVFNQAYAVPPPRFNLQDSNNPPNAFPVKPFYLSTLGNADTNGDHVLDGNESVPYSALSFPSFRYQRLAAATAIRFGKDASGRWVAFPQNSILFLDNDIAVTVQSARYSGFTEIGSLLRNHSTVRCGQGSDCAFVPGGVDNALLLLQNIRTAEAQQP